MSKVPDSETTLEFMVNCKTYPAVSKKYFETVCTGGVQADGSFVRFYPVPFRALDEEERYGRWDVIRAKAYKDTKDPRRESWHYAGGPIKVIKHVRTERQRWDWMKKTIHPSLKAMEEGDITNGCVEIQPIKFYWKPDKTDWTLAQLEVIRQGNLFVNERSMPRLADRIPYEFRLNYKENGIEHDGKVLQWSLYQGLRNAEKSVGSIVKALDVLVQKVSTSIFDSDRKVFGIFGTHSLYGNWMVSALYYVDKKIAQEGSGLF